MSYYYQNPSSIVSGTYSYGNGGTLYGGARGQYFSWLNQNKGNLTYRQAFKSKALRDRYFLEVKGIKAPPKKKYVSRKLQNAKLVQRDCIKYIKGNKKRLSNRSDDYITKKYYCPSTGQCFVSQAERRRVCPKRRTKGTTPKRTTPKRKTRRISQKQLEDMYLLSGLENRKRAKTASACAKAHKTTIAKNKAHWCPRNKVCFMDPMTKGAQKWCRRFQKSE